jgi:hypothetical protein
MYVSQSFFLKIKNITLIYVKIKTRAGAHHGLVLYSIDLYLQQDKCYETQELCHGPIVFAGLELNIVNNE